MAAFNGEGRESVTNQYFLLRHGAGSASMRITDQARILKMDFIRVQNLEMPFKTAICHLKQVLKQQGF